MLSLYVLLFYPDALLGAAAGANCHTQVGNEFGSVEALWSQFEHFMGRSVDGQGQNPDQDQEQEQGQGQGQEHEHDHDLDQSQVKEEEE